MRVCVHLCVHACMRVCVFGIVSRTGACLSQRSMTKYSTVEEKWTEVQSAQIDTAESTLGKEHRTTPWLVQGHC